MATDRTVEIVVIGGGPAGATAAYWLARSGHDVLVVERYETPRDKPCAGLLTPRATTQLAAMGAADFASTNGHAITGIRSLSGAKAVELQWPTHAGHLYGGWAIRRDILDVALLAHAESAGATIWRGWEATQPVADRGFVSGVRAERIDTGEQAHISCRYVVVADGANSRFGRSLGTTRSPQWPSGTATQAFFASQQSTVPWVDIALDVRERDTASFPGYGWVVPHGNGTVNVGVGLLSTYADFKSLNLPQVHHDFVESITDRWQLSRLGDACELGAGMLKMGGSVSPTAGPTFLVAGDAAGMVNPWSGTGIEYAFETGRLAAETLIEAFADDDAGLLALYPKALENRYGRYFATGRLLAHAIGRPGLVGQLQRVSLHRRSLLEWMLRLSLNLLRDDETGPAEAAYQMASRLSRLAPDQ